MIHCKLCYDLYLLLDLQDIANLYTNGKTSALQSVWCDGFIGDNLKEEDNYIPVGHLSIHSFELVIVNAKIK